MPVWSIIVALPESMKGIHVTNSKAGGLRNSS
jgi:hypothetical protein